MDSHEQHEDLPFCLDLENITFECHFSLVNWLPWAGLRRSKVEQLCC